MTRFRPCIDLHEGRVKQIVGGTLDDRGAVENFVTDQSAAHFAGLYRRDGLAGGHVIRLGPGNDEAARKALATFPGGMQIGGGIHAENAVDWIDVGASHVIVTSSLFDGPRFDPDRLASLVRAVGAGRLVVDLSCRRVPDGGWRVATDRWRTVTDLDVTPETLGRLAEQCDEFLIHAADVEGLRGGIDDDLVGMLGRWSGRPLTYAGGIHRVEDIDRIESLSDGNLDYTVGSALDIFGGDLSYQSLVRRHAVEPPTVTPAEP